MITPQPWVIFQPTVQVEFGDFLARDMFRMSVIKKNKIQDFRPSSNSF